MEKFWSWGNLGSVPDYKKIAYICESNLGMVMKKKQYNDVIDPSLNREEGVTHFPKKVARAKQFLEDHPIPAMPMPKGLWMVRKKQYNDVMDPSLDRKDRVSYFPAKLEEARQFIA